MDAKPFGVARCTHKLSYKNDGRFTISFKVGTHNQIGSVILEMDAETAADYETGKEYILTFEPVIHSEGKFNVPNSPK